MLRSVSTFLMVIVINTFAYGQKVWTLDECIEYAKTNNFSLTQARLQLKTAELQLEKAKALQLPSLNFSSNTGIQQGKSIDPTTNSFTTTSLLYQNIGLNANLKLFNWFNLKYNNKATELGVRSSNKEFDNKKEQLVLNVIAAYMQLLEAKTQLEKSVEQIKYTNKQLTITEKLVEAGKLSRLNSIQLKIQLSKDSNQYLIFSEASMQKKMQLKAVLGLNAKDSIAINEHIDLSAATILQMKPESLFGHIKDNRAQQVSDSLKTESIKYTILRTKSMRYPSLDLNAFAGSAYANTFRKGEFNRRSYFQQIGRDNFNQILGLTLSFPILNNRQISLQLKELNLNLQTQLIVSQQNKQLLEQEIYNAYNSATSGFERYNNSVNGERSANELLELIQRKYTSGASPILELLTAINELNNARTEKITNYFEYAFRLKMLESYYKAGSGTN